MVLKTIDPLTDKYLHTMPREIHFVYFDAGYGHRAAATAVLDALRAGGLDWKVSLTDLEKILAPVDIFRKIIGYGLKDIYNMMLRKGWTRDTRGHHS